MRGPRGEVPQRERGEPRVRRTPIGVISGSSRSNSSCFLVPPMSNIQTIKAAYAAFANNDLSVLFGANWPPSMASPQLPIGSWTVVTM